MSAILDRHRQSMLHNVVRGLLNDVATNLADSIQVAELIDTVYLVVRGACAVFSQDWNSRHAFALARCLPVEVLTECLRFLDFQARVRASHVSRRWRAVAMADCRLWTDIHIAPPRLYDAGQYQLEQLLHRSRPLPIRLHVPHVYYDFSDIFTTLRADAHRLEEYAGPASLFSQDTQLPSLTSLDCLDVLSQDDVFIMGRHFSAHSVPNLRRLVAPVLRVPKQTDVYRCLQHLFCHLRDDSNCGQLFRCCPNLITVEFRSIDDDTLLPSGPLPRSLKQVTLRVDENFLATADFSAVLDPWQEVRIPRLSLFTTCIVDPLVQLFLRVVSNDLPVKLTTYDDKKNGEADIILTTEPTAVGDDRFCCQWEIGTDAFWEVYDCFREFHVLCAERLTTLSIAIRHFRACCDARTHAPHLVDLEIRLAGSEAVEHPRDPALGFYLRAPRLRCVAFVIADSFFDAAAVTRHYAAGSTRKPTILETLDGQFRFLIVYDADLLDSITVRCPARHLEEFSAYDFARFAKTYSINAPES